MSELEQLQKDVADAEVAHYGAEAARYSASINARCDARQTKYDARIALSKANKALRGYLKGVWDAV